MNKNKELEALNKIWREAYPKTCETWSTDKLCEHWRLIEKALTPPTADEVCKALSEYYGSVWYKKNEKTFIYLGGKTLETEYRITFDNLERRGLYHLITLVGRFYEGLEEM